MLLAQPLLRHWRNRRMGREGYLFLGALIADRKDVESAAEIRATRSPSRPRRVRGGRIHVSFSPIAGQKRTSPWVGVGPIRDATQPSSTSVGMRNSPGRQRSSDGSYSTPAAAKPPSTLSTWPVMWAASADARKAAAAAMSAGCAYRFRAMRERKASRWRGP